ncbi:hypothetical protein [Ferroplasma sp.]|nr:hypothetical protein [Ferroplasma sp.]
MSLCVGSRPVVTSSMAYEETRGILRNSFQDITKKKIRERI